MVILHLSVADFCLVVVVFQSVCGNIVSLSQEHSADAVCWLENCTTSIGYSIRTAG